MRHPSSENAIARINTYSNAFLVILNCSQILVRFLNTPSVVRWSICAGTKACVARIDAKCDSSEKQRSRCRSVQTLKMCTPANACALKNVARARHRELDFVFVDTSNAGRAVSMMRRVECQRKPKLSRGFGAQRFRKHKTRTTEKC